MRVFLDFSPVAVHKGSEVTQVLMKKCFELVPCDQDKTVCVLLPFVLLLVEGDPVMKEKHGKKNVVSFSSCNSSKIVLTLLIEVIALYVELFTSRVYLEAL